MKRAAGTGDGDRDDGSRGDALEDEAEELFASWLESRDSGRPVELESLSGGRADLLEALRGLRSFWERLESTGAVDRALAGPLADLGLDDVEDPRTARYRVRREVGRGGMGAVFEVEDEHLHRRIAMKVVRTKPGAAGDRALTRFLDEAQVTAQLEHPGIVPVHELGRDDDGRAYFTMALVEGETLSNVFARLFDGDDDWSRARVLDVIAKVGDAVAYAHSRGVVHRDLKPDNVMVGAFGRVFVMDWGLARVASKRASAPSTRRTPPILELEELATDQPMLTHDGDVVGTPAYMAPEQAGGDVDAQGPRCDVYALGAILYHALCGRAPYSDREEGALVALAHGGPTPLLAIDPRIPRELVAICELAMRRDPSRRYPDVGAFTADLRAYLEGRVVGAYESGALAQARKWVLRHRALSVLFVGLAVALTAAWSSELAHGRVRRLAQRFMSLERIGDLDREADLLWPATPEREDELADFVARGEAVAALLPEYREDLARADVSGSDSADAWILGKLGDVVARLDAFANDPGGALPRVRARLERARALGAVRRARPLGPGDVLSLGPDEHSGLPTFEHLPSASTARLRALADPATAPESGDPRERGVVLVEIPAAPPFLIGRTELTCDQWGRIAEVGARGDTPVTDVTWADAVERLARVGLTLPDRDQWTAAALGGRDGEVWFDVDQRDPAASYRENEVFSREGAMLAAPSPVASRRPNPFGLYDVLGNVQELLIEPFYAGARDVPREAWGEPAGLTRVTPFGFFATRADDEEQRRLIAVGVWTEISEDESNPYLGVRAVLVSR
ncbi:MAG: bifunctional serine/threonine-protein kinase/formylglycine-generating enzyme family protein [Planctomycetota bacterium]